MCVTRVPASVPWHTTHGSALCCAVTVHKQCKPRVDMAASLLSEVACTHQPRSGPSRMTIAIDNSKMAIPISLTDVNGLFSQRCWRATSEHEQAASKRRNVVCWPPQHCGRPRSPHNAPNRADTTHTWPHNDEHHLVAATDATTAAATQGPIRPFGWQGPACLCSPLSTPGRPQTRRGTNHGHR